MRVILINVGAMKEVLYASAEQKGWIGRTPAAEKPNFRHKKPRSFDQGLCYRLKVASGFLCSFKAFSGP